MFITFEGPEGAGKSTQIRLLAAFLRANGWQPLLTREPGGTTIGDQIRACLHDQQNNRMSSMAEVLLYSASRAQLVAEVIRPALCAGTLVLCDRFYDSTMAYQGYGRGISLTTLTTLTEFATGGLKPDLTLLLDIDISQGLARRQTGGEEMNRLDMESVAFHQRVRQGFHQLALAEPQRWVVVDAGRAVATVQSDIQRIVIEHLTQKA